MTIEEKAKAYDKALHYAKIYYSEGDENMKIMMSTCFPELEESEDENVREELIKHLKEGAEGYEPAGDCSDYQRWLAWLLKQGNPTDKVEPKFKVGDWVVSEVTGKVYQIKKCIENLSNHKYGYDLINGGYICSNGVNNYHLWTIRDARNDDVLAFKNDICGIIICKSPTDYDTRSYCRLVNDTLINKEESGWDSTLLIPATKEQCELLFTKMKEAGYEWDAEKKELIKIRKDDDKLREAICE